MFTQRYGYGGGVEYDLRPGGAYRAIATAEMQAYGGGDRQRVDPRRARRLAVHPRDLKSVLESGDPAHETVRDCADALEG